MSKANNAPVLRFPGFTGAWERKSLYEIADIVGGGTPSTSVAGYWDGDIDWYAPAEIGESVYVDRSVQRITEEGLRNSSASMLPAHRTVLFTSRAGIGDMAILRRPGCTNQGFQSLVVKGDNDPYFVYSMGHIITEKAVQHASGSTFLEISGKKLGKLGFKFPTPAEQTQIGSFFAHLDALLTSQRNKVEKLEQLKNAMLNKMFPRDGVDVPEVRFPGFTGAWEERLLGEIASFDKGSGYSKSDIAERGTEIILYGSLYTDYQTSIAGTNTFVDVKSGSVISRGGEVLVPASGETSEDIARASAVLKAGIVLGSDLNIVRPPSYIDPVFLALNLTYASPRASLISWAKGKSVVHIHNSDLRKLVVAFPSSAEQTKIGSFFAHLDSLIRLNSGKLAKLGQVKNALLNRMFV